MDAEKEGRRAVKNTCEQAETKGYGMSETRLRLCSEVEQGYKAAARLEAEVRGAQAFFEEAQRRLSECRLNLSVASAALQDELGRPEGMFIR